MSGHLATLVSGFPRLSADQTVYNQFGAPLRTDGKFSGWGKHEGPLGGVNTSFDWYHGARPGPVPHVLNNPGFDGVDYGYHNVWGQVVPDAGGCGVRNVRVQVDLPRAYRWTSATGWTQIRGTAQDVKQLEGGYWSGATFTKQTTWTAGAQFRQEAIGHSFAVAALTNSDGSPSAQSIAHWYYSGFYPRIQIPTGAKVAISGRMRLISDDPAVDLSRAKYLGCISGDLYTGSTTNVGTNGRNPPLAIPRHRYLTDQWQVFTYVADTETGIRTGAPTPFIA